MNQLPTDKLVINSTNHRFGGPGGHIIFSYPTRLTPEQARDVQARHGRYHPCGYGFYDHRYSPITGCTTWKSYSNCD